MNRSTVVTVGFGIVIGVGLTILTAVAGSWAFVRALTEMPMAEERTWTDDEDAQV